MKKIKLLIASMIGAIALVFACVLGTKVNAATISYGFDYSTGSKVEYLNGVVNPSGNYFSTTGNPKKFTASGTSVIDPTKTVSVSESNGGIKLESSSGTVSFTTSNSATVKVLYGSKGKNIKFNGNTVVISSGNTPTESTLVSETISVSSASECTLSRGNGEAWIVQVLVVEDVDDSRTISEIHSVSCSGSYKVGDSVKKSDLTVMALYDGETDYEEISSFTFKVFDSDNNEVVGAFESAGDYKIVAYDMNDEKLSAECEIEVAPATEYTVTFHYENGSSNTSISIIEGNSITQANIPAAPSKDGVSFKGWYTSSNVAVTKDTVINADLDVYAQYYESATMPQSGVSNNILNVSNEDDISDANKNPLTFGIFTAKSTNKGIKINSNNKTAGGMNFTKRLQMQATGSTSDANISATLTKGKLYVVAQVGSLTNDCELKLYNGTEVVASRNVYGQVATAVSFDIEEAGSYTIYGTNTLNYYYVEFVEESIPAVSTPVLEQQESADGSSIRYIATIETEDTDLIVSWNATYTLEGQTDFTTADFTTLYKAVAGTNGKAAATNTYYLVLTLKNISKNYNGKELTCTINVKLEGGQTISSNTKTYTLNVA